ncbi:hypothetical protein [Kitasatospora sp. MAP5-34]|uniref:hypothetical protein n=1 Tax=Kitasatospora sp. MAP5-34 TaxID=3035102 RepID=UPI00247657D8|nr:hypothetical protein [Kitasatospora sp. MAP5-34]MDH6576501.1 hypothetical protein [Kitasatospora sp. MAP5-34]
MTETPITCGKGHVFWANWTPGASVTSIRLGPRRIGWCKAGRHVAVLRHADERKLTPQQRAELYGSDA